MKQVSTHELKQRLASLIAEAEGGTEVLVTRHNKPVARLIAAGDRYLHRGSNFGQGILEPVLSGRTDGRYLEFLIQDRLAE